MNISENKNFLGVSQYKTLSIEEILKAYQTEHLSAERKERLNLAIRLNRQYLGKGKDKKAVQAEVDKVFLVDKGHEAGKELHCVTKKGIIFILNERKYQKGYDSFITALIGRPNQVKRLYDECGLQVSEDILDICKRNLLNGLNEQ